MAGPINDPLVNVTFRCDTLMAQQITTLHELLRTMGVGLVGHQYVILDVVSLIRDAIREAIAEGSFDEQVENWLREDLAI